MRHFIPAVLLCAAATVAQGETRLDAEAFDRMTLGRTLTFSHEGQPYGMEQYLPNRRVIWAFIGDRCEEGSWYEREGMICFVYDYNPTNEQCWSFFATDRGLRGVFDGPDGPSTELYEIQRSTAPLSCAAPGVGV
jgi:hypothetical protein